MTRRMTALIAWFAFTLLLIAGCAPPQAQPDLSVTRERVIAVMRFQEIGEQELAATTTESFITSFAQTGSFRMVERTQLDRAIEELQLGESGLVDPSTAKQVGKFIGADIIVVGSVATLGDQVMVNGRFIDVESGAILVAESRRGRRTLDSIQRISDEMVARLTRAYAVQLQIQIAEAEQIEAEAEVEGVQPIPSGRRTVAWTQPGGGDTDVELTDLIIAVGFSEIVDQAAVEAAFRFTDDAGESVSGFFDWWSDLEFAFQPDEPLAPDTSYTVTIDTAAGIEVPHTTTFTTEPLRVLRVFPRDGATDVPLSPDFVFSVEFNTAMDRAAVEEHLTIQDEQGEMVTPSEVDWYGFDNSSVFELYPDRPLNPETTYTITVPPEATARNGTGLRETYTSTFTTEPLRVINVSPRDGATNVRLVDTEIAVAFNTLMDRATVEEHLTIQDQGGESAIGQIEWSEEYDRSVFSLYLDVPLNPGGTYTITVPPEVTAQNGVGLQAPFTSSFTTERLRVTKVFPRDGATDVKLDTSFAVEFNAAMDRAAVEEHLIIRDERGEGIIGQLSWYGYDDSSAFDIYLDVPLNPETTYTITVPSEATAQNGAGLPEPYTTTFTTGLLRVINVFPRDGTTNVKLDTSFTVEFNAIMDRATVEEHLIIQDERGEGIVGQLSWYGHDDSSVFDIYPDLPLNPRATYTITIPPEATARNGVDLREPYIATFTTGPLRTTGFEPRDGASGISPESTQVTITFNALMDRAVVEAAFRIVDADGIPVNGEFDWWSENGFSFYPEVESNTTYTVILTRDAVARNGVGLEEELRFSFTTGR